MIANAELQTPVDKFNSDNGSQGRPNYPWLPWAQCVPSPTHVHQDRGTREVKEPRLQEPWARLVSPHLHDSILLAR